MRSAFLLVAGRGRQGPEPDAAALTAAGQPAGLTFIAAEHARWTDAAGAIHLGVWQEEQADEKGRTRWRLEPHRAAMAVGSFRRRGRPWGSEPTWVEHLDGLSAHAPLGDRADDFEGIYQALVLADDGHGIVFGDPWASRCLFWGSNATTTAVASQAGLVAHALADPGACPTRNALAVCSLAHARQGTGTHTGYEGVRSLAPGHSVVVDPEGGARIQGRPAPWLPGHDLADASEPELLDLAEAAIGEALTAGLTYPADEHLIDLTGGKDTRLVLAVAVRAGVMGRYLFRTDGPPRLGDAQVARELAESLGLPYESGVGSGTYEGTYLERMQGFVRATAGLQSLWMFLGPGPAAPRVRVCGKFGEALRTTVGRDFETIDEVVAFSRRNFGKLGLLHADGAEWCARETEAEVLSPGLDAGSPRDLLDAYLMRVRARFAFGPRADQRLAPRLFPLASPAAVRAVFAMGEAARDREALNVGLCQRASPMLVSHRFVGPGWLVPPPVPASPPPSPKPSGPSGGSATPRSPASATTVAADRSDVPQVDGTTFGALHRDQQHDKRTEALREIFADRDSAAWELLDRSATLEALGRYEQITNLERRELFGAATAVLWLGDTIEG